MEQESLVMDVGVRRAMSFINAIIPAPHPFDVRFWDGTLISGNEPRFTLVLDHPGALRRMFRPPLELSLGEAFIRGDFDIEGDLLEVFKLFFEQILAQPPRLPTAVRAWLTLPTSQSAARPIERGPLQRSGTRHSKERDRAAIQYHYDVGNDFYALWLDSRMVYSCGYFPTGTEDIDTAQALKLDYICRKLRLQPGERLLDIGCGWGGLVIHAAQNYGVSALGVTLSEQQQILGMQRIIDAGLRDAADIQLLDYRDLAHEMFDKVVSVGMFEHVGRNRLPEYFGHAYRLLKPGGLFLNHGISSTMLHEQKTWRALPGRALERFVVGFNTFSQRYIFPDGELVPLSEANLAAERSGFEVRDVENWREHYALTLREWVSRLEQRKDEAVDLVGEDVYRTWKLYMSAAIYGFETGHTSVNQSVLAKPAHGIVGLPYSRAYLYQKEIVSIPPA